ncbi:hypothetical protein UFOVP32_2 [uncultured Caudovirales phage]|uniref:Uncharacterized protein n=1 Tax=uncultured Caudovirales phage TaxID=2100421 RepID=A0A6J5KMB2_9CAUD|nr:hypothetical protein UFOVP32_2 [uncultured Caudovirales phage]CAB4123845.1 hypothetical protein UFOVP50_74 [uncultured Caudovirales phage]
MAQKPEEIEGSKARAEDRAQPYGMGFFAEATSADKRYLGSASDVPEIVRDFCIGVHEIRSAAGKGEIAGAEALRRLNALAQQYSDIFYGKSDGYRAMAWNSPDGLGVFINTRLGIQEPEEQAAHTLFMNTANQILAAYERHQNGDLNDEDVAFHIEAAIDDASAILLGLPLENED